MQARYGSPHPQDFQLPAMCYFLGRIFTFLALAPNSYAGVGDLPEYASWATLPGWPYLHSWSEYPPIFPLINSGLYKLAGGQSFLYDLMIAMLLALAGAACLVLFGRIAARVFAAEPARQRTWIFLALLLPLPYTWWYFDLVPLAFLLLGLLWLQEGRSWRSGLAVGVGMLLKWFPGLLLAAACRYSGGKRAARVTLAALGLTGLVLGGLLLASPQMTLASLKAQTSRSSWQTVWALVDGNLSTGAFLLLNDRLDPAVAGIPRGLPARIPSLVTLPFFGALGAWLFFRARAGTDRSLLAFVGLTWVVFLSWSSGWSPQWILYLLPVILLTLPQKRAFYGAAGLILMALIEWPTLLAHAFFEGLWVIVPLRMGLFLWLGIEWYRQTRQDEPGGKPIQY